jgi:DNA polymerase I
MAVDFEFHFGGHASFEEAARSGERPRPVCMVAKELRSGQTWRLWDGEFGPRPPFPIGADAGFVAYYASAELGCFRALGWPRPANILDLFTEFRVRTNGLPTLAGSGLVGALVHFGLDTIGVQEKDELRLRILRGGPWSAEEREAFLAYCTGDVDALERLLPAMLPGIDLPRALLRGRYMAAAAAMEWAGTPIDIPTLALLREHWADIQDDLIRAIDANYNVFDGRSFHADRWARFLTCRGIPWPLREDGHLDLKSDTFREMAKAYPIVAPIHELRHALSQLRLNDLAVGHDGRNRTILSAFRARTGRNQPSNSRYIFGPSVWLRGLIKPPPGHGVAYIDWEQQEFGIAAALSGDEAMQAAYRSGEVYITFGKQIGALPADATREQNEDAHALFKAVCLGLIYGMEDRSLAFRIGQPPIVARELIRLHHEIYWKFWEWSDAAVNFAMLHGSLHTVFGWQINVGESPNPRSLRNFPMQANGAEMLRLACCLATERGIEVCAPVHDAILICATLDRLDEDIARTRATMAEASRIVLGGFELQTEAKVVRYPDRFMDRRGVVMWDRVLELINKRRTAVAI